MRDVWLEKIPVRLKKNKKNTLNKYNNYKYGKLKLQKMAATKLQV